MTIRIQEDRPIPAEACVFHALAVLADPMIDEEDDEEDEAAEKPAGEEDDAEAAEDDAAEEDDAEAAEGDEEDDEEDEEEPAEEDDGRSFTVVANSGKPMNGVPFWGTLAIQLDGIKAKRRVPALMDHDVTQRVGFYESSQLTANGLEMRGKFLKRSKLAQKVNTELRDGFPYEASVRLQPTKVEEIAAGASAEVNGEQLDGPAFIFRESELRETSLVTLGQDPHTAAAALSSGGEIFATFTKTEKQDQKTMTDQTVGARDVAAEAVAGERSRIAQLNAAALPEQGELLASLIADGATLSEGIAKLHSDLQTRFKARSDERHRQAPASLSAGNSDAPAKRQSTLEKIRAMPASAAKFAKLFELDVEVAVEFTDSDEYVAFEMQQLRTPSAAE